MATKAVTLYQYQLNPSNNNHSVSNNLSQDVLAIEEPLQIWLNYYDQALARYQLKSLTITMRTSGQDHQLAIGLLLAEGIISQIEQIESINTLDHDVNVEPEALKLNQLEVTLAWDVFIDWRQLERQFVSQTSCGLCGKAAIQALALQRPIESSLVQPNLIGAEPKVSAQQVSELPELLRNKQPVFTETGAVHGAGFFVGNKMVAVQEDVGRHNAVDKLIGQLALAKQDLTTGVLVLSGRISFDLVQKAVFANISIIVAVGAPSSMALLAAQQFDITLIGFTKAEQFNVYHGHWRLG